MTLGFEILFVAGLVLMLNVMDSVTTHLCIRQYPDKELKGEGNPFMRKLMLKNRLLAEVLKHGSLIALVVYYLWIDEIGVLRFLAILLGLVVLNNSYIFLSRAIMRRKTPTPFKLLQRVLSVSDQHADKYGYAGVMTILCTISAGIYYLISLLV